MVIVACSTCGAKLRGRDEMIGKKGKCPKCGAIFVFAPPVVEPTIEQPPSPSVLRKRGARGEGDDLPRDTSIHTPNEDPLSRDATLPSPPVLRGRGVGGEGDDTPRDTTTPIPNDDVLTRDAVPPHPAPLPPEYRVEREPTSDACPTVGPETPPALATRDAPSRSFHTDLAVLYATLDVRDETAHLPTLAALFNARRQSAADRQRRFKNDLTQTYVSIAPPNLERHLTLLAHQLSNWRTKSKSRMAAYFAKLPDDDPLRCPISLFGVMERGRLETAHTAVLAWMLDPRREHGFKDVLLVELLRRLCGPDQVTAVLVVDKCEPEFAIDDGRLDVLVQGTARQSEDASWFGRLMLTPTNGRKAPKAADGVPRCRLPIPQTP